MVFKIRAHAGAWILLLILAIQSLHSIPARHRFLSHLPADGHDPRLVMCYIAVMPLLFGAAYLLFVVPTWIPRKGSSRWYLPRPSIQGWLALGVVLLTLLSLDYLGFTYFFRSTKAPVPMPMDFLYTFGQCVGVGFFANLINGLDEERMHTASRAGKAAADLLEARTRLVVAQLDPHNLINVLANVGSLIHQDPAKASEMLQSAGYYLRRLLDATKAPRIALWQEREIIEDYLAVETIRLGARLQVEWDWPETFDDVHLPPILVQPMVENAIKHGVWPWLEGGVVRLSAQQEGTALVVSVRNTGAPLAGDYRPGATGLENLRHRLAHEYGDAGRFELVSDGQWTIATVKIPLEA